MGSSRSLFSRPASAYYLILGSLVALTALGLVMVLSASSVTALNENGNSFAYVLRQAMFLVLSVGIAWVAMKLRAQLWLTLSYRFSDLCSFIGVATNAWPWKDGWRKHQLDRDWTIHITT